MLRGIKFITGLVLAITVFFIVGARPTHAQLSCNGSGTTSYTRYNCGQTPFGQYFCSGSQSTVGGNCNWAGSTCQWQAQRPDFYCNANANGCVIGDAVAQGTNGCYTTGPTPTGGGPTPTPTPGGWGSCGSCGSCGGPGSECRLAPDGQCLWDPGSCSAPPISPFCTVTSISASADTSNLSVGDIVNVTVGVDGSAWPPDGSFQFRGIRFTPSSAGVMTMTPPGYPVSTYYDYNICCSTAWGPQSWTYPIRANSAGSVVVTATVYQTYGTVDSCSGTFLVNVCAPNCATACGQADGCGGTCGSGDVGTLGAWSACTAPTFTRTRQTDAVCNPAATETEACTGTITGTIFDASDIDSCALIGSAPVISGVTVDMQATVNHATLYQTTTDSLGSYTGSSLPIPETYAITLSGPDEFIYSAPKLYCDGALSATLSTQAEVATRRYGLWRFFGGWFQASGGGVYGKTGVSVQIPAACQEGANQVSCNNFDDGGTTRTPLVIRGTGGSAGVSYFGSGSLDLGGGGTVPSNARASQDGWSASSSYSERLAGYDYFNLQSAQFQNTVKTDWDGTGKPSGASNDLYQTTNGGTLDLGTAVSPVAGETIVIFHDGDVSITSNITVPQGAYLAVISSGSIRVASAVTSAQGVYLADDNFEVLSTGNTATEQRFVGEGTFVGLTGVNLLRDRGVTNNSESSEYFIFRPDFVINAPFGLKLPQYVWREVAP